MSPRDCQCATGGNDCRVGAAVILIAVLAWARAAFAGEPLACPPGTKPQSRTSAKGALAEWCADEKTGTRSGPQREFRADGTLAAEGTNDPVSKRSTARIFDEQGILTDEITIENRKVIERRMTLAGVRKFVAEMNEGREDPAATFRAIDERTIGVDFHFADADPRKGMKKLEMFRAYIQRSFCKLLTGPERIDSIQVRVLNDRDPDPAMSTVIRRDECPPAG